MPLSVSVRGIEAGVSIQSTKVGHLQVCGDTVARAPVAGDCQLAANPSTLNVLLFSLTFIFYLKAWLGTSPLEHLGNAT